MMARINEFVRQQQAVAEQVHRFGEEPIASIREVAVSSPGDLKSLKTPAEHVVDLVLGQAELLAGTRDRFVDEATRAVEIFKVAGRDMHKVGIHVYGQVLEKAEEELPRQGPPVFRRPSVRSGSRPPVSARPLPELDRRMWYMTREPRRATVNGLVDLARSKPHVDEPQRQGP